MHDEYAFWRAALVNPSEIGKSLKIHEGDPQPGFYRKRAYKDGPFLPVAIWTNDGEIIALVSGQVADPNDIWTFACRNPISEAMYNAAMAGDGWPESDPVVDRQKAPSVGHNSGDIDEAEMLRDQIEAAKQGAEAYASITSDDTLPKAQSLRARLLELKGEAEKKHKKEKEPHLEAGRAVDKKWLPLAKEADALAASIRSAMGAWETEKLRKQREVERVAETARMAAEIAARKEAEAGRVVVDAPPLAPPAVSAPAPIKGSYGRAASVSVVHVVTAITDQAALYNFLKDHPDLKNCMFDLAKRAVAKGRTVPGVSVEEQAKVA